MAARIPGWQFDRDNNHENTIGLGAHSSSTGLLRFRGEIPQGAYLAIAIAALMILGVTWQLITSTGFFPSEFFPSPKSVIQAGINMLSSREFLVDIVASSARIGVAFLASALLAIPLGLLMSSFKPIEALIEPLVDFIRYVPVPSLIPIFIIWGGIGEPSKFLVLFFGTFFQLVLLIMDDANNVPRIYFDLARTLGASTPQLIRDVLIPYLRPQIYNRLRITLGWCWTYLVIAELIAVERGIGHTLKEAQRFSAADQMFVCFIVLGLIGLFTDYLAKSAYRHLFPYAVKTIR